MRPVPRYRSCHSTTPLLRPHLVLPHSHLVALDDKFEDLIGWRSALPTSKPAHSSCLPLCVYTDLQWKLEKVDIPPVLLWDLAVVRLQVTSKILEVFTKGSLCYDVGTSIDRLPSRFPTTFQQRQGYHSCPGSVWGLLPPLKILSVSWFIIRCCFISAFAVITKLTLLLPRLTSTLCHVCLLNVSLSMEV